MTARNVCLGSTVESLLMMVTLAAAKNGGEGRGGGIRIGGGHCCDILYIAPLVLTSQMHRVCDTVPLRPQGHLCPQGSHTLCFIYTYSASLTPYLMIEKGGNGQVSFFVLPSAKQSPYMSPSVLT